MNLDSFIKEQLEVWPMARRNFEALAEVKIRKMVVGGMSFRVQFNPARMVSTGAKVDAASVNARPCFLCDANRPPEQSYLSVLDGYRLLLNPFPIFQRHLTIPACIHTPQLLAGRIGDMFELARMLDGYTVFYNGPHCGASAPDHFHFQAVESRELPLLEAIDRDCVPFRVETGCFSAREELEIWFSSLCDRLKLLPENNGEPEPRMNVLAVGEGNLVEVVVIPRRTHRPSFYGFGEDRVLVSPASVDLGGVIISPVSDDFENKIDDRMIERIIKEVCYEI